MTSTSSSLGQILARETWTTCVRNSSSNCKMQESQFLRSAVLCTRLTINFPYFRIVIRPHHTSHSSVYACRISLERLEKVYIDASFITHPSKPSVFPDLSSFTSRRGLFMRKGPNRHALSRSFPPPPIITLMSVSSSNVAPLIGF